MAQRRSLGLLLGCRALPERVWPFGSGSVEGRIVGEIVEEGSWVVVYLEADGGWRWRGIEKASLRAQPGGLTPALLVVAAGQTVEIVNEETIHHRLFSTSPQNGFELPTLAAGESVRVAFDHPGAVRVYCSLHPGESSSIFVAPSSHFTLVRAPGRYSIQDVPPGRYGVGAWSERASAPADPITVRSGSSAVLEIAFGEAGP